MDPNFVTPEALDRAVERLEAAMTRGFDKLTGDISRIGSVADAHTVQLSLDAYRIGEIEKKAKRLEDHRWQLWGMVTGAAGTIGGLVAWLTAHYRP